jgi:hypothetical protein
VTHEQSLLAIYAAYPRREGRRKALQSIERAIQRILTAENKTLADAGILIAHEDRAVSFLIDAVKEFALTPAGNRGLYVPHPTTWFNQSRYLDDRNQWWNASKEEMRQINNQREANVGIWRPT